jgi:hypothetical protein
LKAKDKEESELKYEKNLERMAKKELIMADFGKKKMLRANIPEHKKYVSKHKKVKQDLDFVKYFGDDVDFSNIPEEDEPEPVVVKEES